MGTIERDIPRVPTNYYLQLLKKYKCYIFGVRGKNILNGDIMSMISCSESSWTPWAPSMDPWGTIKKNIPRVPTNYYFQSLKKYKCYISEVRM